MIPALSFAGIAAGYGTNVLLRDLSVDFPSGTLTGLVGPNGAGKTTLLRVALGIVAAREGDVRVAGRELETWSREALARTIAYLPQSADAQWPVAARSLAALGRLPHRAPFADLSAEDLARVSDALARCDALAFADRRVDELSSGERARVLLARALATDAAILLVDEPAAHLDPAHQLRLMELLRQEAGRGAAVVVTLHDLSLAARFCDRIVVLKSGRLVASGTPDEALSEAILGEAFGIRPWALEAFPSDRPPIVPWRLA